MGCEGESGGVKENTRRRCCNGYRSDRRNFSAFVLGVFVCVATFGIFSLNMHEQPNSCGCQMIDTLGSMPYCDLIISNGGIWGEPKSVDSSVYHGLLVAASHGMVARAEPGAIPK